MQRQGKATKVLIGDFETTVYENQERTEVWASAIVEMYSEDVKIFHSIDDTYEYLISLNSNCIVYYHNLKFDGSFWLDYLLKQLHLPQAMYVNENNPADAYFYDNKDMPNNSFKYCISDMGMWYSFTIKTHNHYIELRDSLKLLPFSVAKIGKSFDTKHKKLDMDYTGFRYAGCVITDEEKEYIANDVLVIKEALEIMYNENHKKLTIGSCCLEEYKKTKGRFAYNEFFPDLTEIPIDYDLYESKNADEYIRKSYKGGWCYLVPSKADKIINNGITADVNSLYPSMMSSESGNKYPVGRPTFWKGNYIPDEAVSPDYYFFVRIRTRFKIKPNYLPCIQIKNSFRYMSNEWLETSDVELDGKKFSKIRKLDGTVETACVELTLTETDYRLIQEHYNLYECEILDGCYFQAEIGIFDEYINKYKEIKLNSKGAIRELAKLFLNNLYGKMASSNNSSFKYAYIKPDGNIGFYTVFQFEKKSGYIAVGSAITSYARNFTIRTAQKNYYGKDKAGFIYADTDSIHCNLSAEQLKGLTVHDKNFCCWKLESSWDTAIFNRQKTYIEHIVAENLQPIDNPFYNVKCAGMPEHCKNLFIKSLKGMSKEEWEEKEADEWNEMTDQEKEFVVVKRTLSDFKIGLCVPSKLMPKRIDGGIVLTETTYEMR